MDLKSRMFKKFALLLFALFIVNSLASYFYWYESFHGFDKVMHFTGGVVGSFFLSWFLYKKYIGLLEKKKLRKLFLINTAIVFGAAFLWEIMEFSAQALFGVDHLLATPWDSVGDLFFGVLGSLVGLTYFLNKVRNLGLVKRNNGN